MDDSVVLEGGLDMKKLMAGGDYFTVDQSFQEEDIDLFEGISDNDNDSVEGVTLPHEAVHNPAYDYTFLDAPGKRSFEDIAQTMVDILPSGDIKMRIIEEGTGPLIPDGSRIKAHYALYWEYQEIAFDSTAYRNHADVYILGRGKLLPAIEHCIQSLKGPQAYGQFLLSPKVTWGELGAPPFIPGNKTCMLSIRILEVSDIGALSRFEQMDDSERKSFTNTMKGYDVANEDAKQFFKSKKYSQAIKLYHKCQTILRFCNPDNEEETKSLRENIVKTFLNLAVCYNKLDNTTKAILMINELGNVTSLYSNGKALYQYALAHESQGSLEEALHYYKMALKVSPSSSEIANRLSTLKKTLSSYSEQETSMWKTAFHQDAASKRPTKNVIDSETTELFHYECKQIVSGNTDKFQVPPSITPEEVDSLQTILQEFEGLTMNKHEDSDAATGFRYTISKALE